MGLFDEPVQPRPIPQVDYSQQLAHAQQMANVQAAQQAVPVQQPDYSQQTQMQFHAQQMAQAEIARKVYEAANKPVKKNWLKLIGFAIAGLFALLLLIAASVALLFHILDRFNEPEDSSESNQTIVTSNPAEHFIVNYSSGLSQLYAEAAAKARAGDFSDLKEARDYFQPNMESIKKQSFAKMGQALDSINGANWSNDAAADLFETFSEGLR